MPPSNIHKTRGIILHHLKYSESSIIAKVYTENFGIQSFIVRGVRKKGSKTKAGLFQPLSLVEMVVYHNEKSNIQNLKEVKNAFPFKSIPFDIYKSTITIFLNEILFKTLKEEEPNLQLFNYIFDAIEYLDQKEDNYFDFHILFIILLSKYLGFFPKNNYSKENTCFDLTEGIFVKNIPGHQHFIDEPISKYLSVYLAISFSDLDNNKLSYKLRKEFLEKLLEYYKIHIEGFGNLKSYPVLQAIYNSN